MYFLLNQEFNTCWSAGLFSRLHRITAATDSIWCVETHDHFPYSWLHVCLNIAVELILRSMVSDYHSHRKGIQVYLKNLKPPNVALATRPLTLCVQVIPLPGTHESNFCYLNCWSVWLSKWIWCKRYIWNMCVWYFISMKCSLENLIYHGLSLLFFCRHSIIQLFTVIVHYLINILVLPFMCMNNLFLILTDKKCEHASKMQISLSKFITISLFFLVYLKWLICSQLTNITNYRCFLILIELWYHIYDN